MTREAIVAAALSWRGTPFVHQGRLKGVGVDCIGLIIGVAHEVGLTDYDFNGYSEQPDPRVLMHELNSQMQQIPNSQALPGDVLLFRMRRDPQHFAFLVDNGEPWQIVHAYRKVGQCVQHGLEALWRPRLIGVYRFPGL